MILVRTPYRISFFGGGTDYPAWFREHGGAVLSATIDKYCWITARWLPPFFEHRSRIVWSQIEHVTDHRDIRHPAVRAALEMAGIDGGVEIHHQGDLPARSGIGSSSSFAVGVLHALAVLQGRSPLTESLAVGAIRLEQEHLGEHVGCQDQIAAAFGGFNRIDFHADGGFRVVRLALAESPESHCLLFFTGQARDASEIAAHQLDAIPHRVKELAQMQAMVDEAQGLFERGAWDEIGCLLHESWCLKRSLTPFVSTPRIDEIYQRARDAGALGGKLLGAGGGGFLFLFSRPEYQGPIRRALSSLVEVPVRFEFGGSRVQVREGDPVRTLWAPSPIGAFYDTP